MVFQKIWGLLVRLVPLNFIQRTIKSNERANSLAIIFILYIEIWKKNTTFVIEYVQIPSFPSTSGDCKDSGTDIWIGEVEARAAKLLASFSVFVVGFVFISNPSRSRNWSKCRTRPTSSNLVSFSNSHLNKREQSLSSVVGVFKMW